MYNICKYKFVTLYLQFHHSPIKIYGGEEAINQKNTNFTIQKYLNKHYIK